MTDVARASREPVPPLVGGPTAAKPADLGDADRVRASRRMLREDLPSPALNRLVALTARLLRAEASQVSLLTDVQAVAAGLGLGPGVVGSTSPLGDSLCSVTAARGAPLVVARAAVDERVAHLPPVVSGAVGSYLGVPLVDMTGHTVGALCVHGTMARTWSDDDVRVLADIADTVTAELELGALAAERDATRVRLGLATDAAGVGSFDLDVATRQVRCDPRLLDMLGLDLTDVVRTLPSLATHLHPEDAPRAARAVHAALTRGGELDVDVRIVQRTGDARWISARGEAVMGSDGRPVRLLGLAFDTTEHRDDATRVARVLETMPSAFISVDRGWRLTYVNSSAEKLLGRGRDRLLATDLWTEFPDLVGSALEAPLRTAMRTGQPSEFEGYQPPPLDRWYETRVWPGPDGLSVYFHDGTERHLALDLAERARADAAAAAIRVDLLGEVSSVFANELDPDLALATLARLVVPALAESCVVSMVDDRARMRDVESRHPGASRRVGIGDRGHDLVLPLTARGRRLGTLTLRSSGSRGPLGALDVATAKLVAARAGLGLDNARLYREQRTLAETLQTSMLTPPVQPAGMQIVVRYVPAAAQAQVGGDWYDAFLQPDGTTVLTIGDVVGHDTASAAAMGQVRSLLRGIAYTTGEPPHTILARLDQALRGLGVGTTATVVVAGITPDEAGQNGGATVRWSSAGHPPPMIVQPNGVVQVLVSPRYDLLLGIDAATPRSQSVARLERGATLFLYTDGLVERRTEGLTDGLARLSRTLAGLATLDLDSMCDEALARMVPAAPEDDVALVAVRLMP